MAGIRVVVCLPAEARHDLRAALDQAMAPFRMDANPRWRYIWDWWAIRGGSDGSGFSPLPGHEDSPRLVHDDPHYDGTPLPSLPGQCAGGPRGLLDLTEFRELSDRVTAVRSRAGDPWDFWQHLKPDHPPLQPWSAFWARHQADPQGYPAERLRHDFAAQPLLQAFTADPLSQIPGLHTIAWHYQQAGLLDTLDGPRPSFVARMTDLLPQPDLLTLDGWWIEDGTFPVHGHCEAAETCPHLDEGNRYQRDIGGYLTSLPDDALLIKLKCHG
ncbi:hypothetical protein ABT095_04765 [Kitasatospora sp. NPDC002227]|uniref:hypothetical protein n=1 Tax=Kitasatospora sp. NPDC002227 TaxID=3154773 RepID=UPI00331A08B3